MVVPPVSEAATVVDDRFRVAASESSSPQAAAIRATETIRVARRAIQQRDDGYENTQELLGRTLRDGPHRTWPRPPGTARERLSYDLAVPNHPTRDDIDLLAGEFYAGDPHEACTWMRDNAPVYYDETQRRLGARRLRHGHDGVDRQRRLLQREGDPPARRYSTVDDRHGRPRPQAPPQAREPRLHAAPGARPGRLVREICDEIIDDVCERGSCDFVCDIAAPLPLIMIGDMLGFRARQTRRSAALVRRDGARPGPAPTPRPSSRATVGVRGVPAVPASGDRRTPRAGPPTT